MPVPSFKRYRWWIGVAGALVSAFIVVYIAARRAAERFEPTVRQQLIAYLHDRFQADVQIAALHIRHAKMPALDILLKRGRGAMVDVEAQGISLRFLRSGDLPPLFTIRKLSFRFDLGDLVERKQTVQQVTIDGMKVAIPPRNGVAKHAETSARAKVLVKEVHIQNAVLSLLSRDPKKEPLLFDISQLRLTSVGIDQAMRYEATLTNPKPPGKVESTGTFGPWVASEPGETPLGGDYRFEKADLGVFRGIAGTLTSTGTFAGTLNAVQASGRASVPNFRLKNVGNPVPLSTRFEVLVDGTNGDTVLKPVQATLGHTQFKTSGAIIRHERGSP